MTTNIDPATVPAWPAPEVRLTGQGMVDVEGVSLHLPPGLDGAEARRWAVRHVASKYQRLGRPIRVTAIEADGTRFPLLVHPADGTVQAAPEEAPARRRGLRLPSAPRKGGINLGKNPGEQQEAGKSQARGLIAMGVFLGVIALIAVVILNAGGSGDVTQAPNTRTRATASGPATPPPANLPKPAPDGWTTRAAWALPVSADVTPAVAPNGTVATVTDKGELTVLDPATGVTRWTAEAPDGSSGALVFTRIDGRDVLALSAGQTLNYWPLDGPQHPRTTAELPSTGGTISFAGDSPLVNLDEATAGVITHGKVRTVDLPAKSTALAADGKNVLAADGTGHVWTLSTDQKKPGKGLQLQPPGNDKGKKGKGKAKKAPARLARVLGVDSKRLVGIWQNGTSTTATAYAAHDGKPLATAKADQNVDFSTVRSADELVAVGPLLLNTADGTSREATGTTPTAAAAGRIYAVDQQQRTHALTADTDTVIGGDDVALPLGVADRRALVVADKLGQRMLYALSPGTSGQQPAPGNSGQVEPPQPPGQSQ